MRSRAVAVVVLTFVSRLAAQESQDVIRLEPMVVTASRLPQPLNELPGSVSVVGDDGLHNGRADVGPEEALARVPGVFAQSSTNLAQDMRLTIRGFGARSAFGVREVKILLDGLPLTYADGQSELDEIDVSAIDRIEVLRGAAANLYGNAAGGVVQFFTPSPDASNQARGRGLGGSYGLFKTHVSGNATVDPVHGFLSASFLRLDGYRDHSAAQRLTLLGTSQVDVSPQTRARVIVTGLDTFEAQDPGGLTADEAHADRRQARPGAARFDTGEEVLQGRLGTIVEHDFDRGMLNAYGFGLYRDVSSFLPIDPMVASPAQGGAISVHRVGAGGGLTGSAHLAWLSVEHRVTSGVDVQYQRDHRRRFANEDGSRGELGLDQIEEVSNVGPFIRYAALLTPQLEMSTGVRYDYYDFAVDTGGGDRVLDAWSPGGGIWYSPWSWGSAFADVGTAFQVPTTTELANPGGPGFNSNVDPQTATSTEGGIRVNRAGVDASATGFVIDVRDVLVPFELPTQPGRTFYRNESRALRTGFELEGHAEPLTRLFATVAFSLIDARFVDAADTDCCDGNREPGVPPLRLYSELAYRPLRGLGGALELQWTDDSYVDDANTAKSSSAVVCNVRLTYEHAWNGWSLLAGVGLNNIFNDQYDGRVRVNAQGGRYFEPAARFNAYGTLEVAWAGTG